MEAKGKHLEFIQTTINRMASNSFLLKGWAVTLVGGLVALSFKEMDWRYVAISAAVISFFWLLDGYYLSRERLFIKLYDHARTVAEANVDFSMDTKPFSHHARWFACTRSMTLLLFYGGLLLIHIFILCNLKTYGKENVFQLPLYSGRVESRTSAQLGPYSERDRIWVHRCR
jgi:hypothetical protein